MPIGLDYNLDIEPNVTLAQMQQQMYGYALGAGIDLSQNSDLRSLDIQGKMLDQTVTLRKFAWIPTLGASININWLSLSNGPPSKTRISTPTPT